MQTLITEDMYTWQCVGLWTVLPVGQKSVNLEENHATYNTSSDIGCQYAEGKSAIRLAHASQQ